MDRTHDCQGLGAPAPLGPPRAQPHVCSTQTSLWRCKWVPLPRGPHRAWPHRAQSHGADAQTSMGPQAKETRTGEGLPVRCRCIRARASKMFTHRGLSSPPVYPQDAGVTDSSSPQRMWKHCTTRSHHSSPRHPGTAARDSVLMTTAASQEASGTGQGLCSIS